MHAIRIDARAAGSSCAAIAGILYILCAVAYAIAPDGTLAFFSIVFHGLDLRKIVIEMTWGGTIGGFLVTIVGAYVLTWLWATWYNRMCCSGGVAGATDDCCKKSGGSDDCCRK